MTDKVDFAYQFHDMKHGWQCPCGIVEIIKMINNNREFDEFIIKSLGGEIKKCPM